MAPEPDGVGDGAKRANDERGAESEAGAAVRDALAPCVLELGTPLGTPLFAAAGGEEDRDGADDAAAGSATGHERTGFTVPAPASARVMPGYRAMASRTIPAPLAVIW